MSDTAPARAHHILVIEVDPCPACAPAGPCEACRDDPVLRYSVECPGVTDVCRAWAECMENHDDDDEVLDGTGVAHGVRHEWYEFDSWWGVPTQECAAQGYDDLPDAADGLSAGRHEFSPVWDDGCLDIVPRGGAR